MPHACNILSRHNDFHGFTTCFFVLDEYHQRRRSWGSMQAMMSTFAMCEPGSRRAYADGCAKMFEWVGQRLGISAVPAQSGLSRARVRVTDDELDRLWSMATTWTSARQSDLDRLVPGRPLIGIDGTSLIMRRSASLSAAYGIRRDREGAELSHYPEALMTSCWDLDARMPVAWCTQSVLAKGGERAMAASMLGDLPDRSIVVLDAGYPSRNLFGEIIDQGHDLVVRMVASEAGSWPEVQEFMASKRKSAWIDTKVGHGNSTRILRLRYIMRKFSKGRPQRGQTRREMIVITSLSDDTLNDDQVINIYHRRWTIETIHDELKNLSCMETWHSTTKQGVEQEILCHMLWHLLAGHIASHLEAESRAANPGRKVRSTTPRVMRAIVQIVDCALESVGQPQPVQDYLRGKAERALSEARRSLVTKRQRPSRPRKAFHPYAKPRRNHG